VFEQGNTPGKIPMLDPSSFIIDTSRDEELVRKLFSDLNRDIHGPLGDSKIMFLTTPTTTMWHKRRRLPISNPRQLLLLLMMILQR
jgi:hypothetical protein